MRMDSRAHCSAVTASFSLAAFMVISTFEPGWTGWTLCDGCDGQRFGALVLVLSAWLGRQQNRAPKLGICSHVSAKNKQQLANSANSEGTSTNNYNKRIDDHHPRNVKTGNSKTQLQHPAKTKKMVDFVPFQNAKVTSSKLHTLPGWHWRCPLPQAYSWPHMPNRKVNHTWAHPCASHADAIEWEIMYIWTEIDGNGFFVYTTVDGRNIQTISNNLFYPIQPPHPPILMLM